LAALTVALAALEEVVELEDVTFPAPDADPDAEFVGTTTSVVYVVP
jgi:hypothetical protein